MSTCLKVSPSKNSKTKRYKPRNQVKKRKKKVVQQRTKTMLTRLIKERRQKMRKKMARA